MIHTPALSRHADIHLSTGVRLQYVEQGAAGAHPIVMLHGYTDSWFSFSRALPAIAGNYHVFVPD